MQNIDSIRKQYEANALAIKPCMEVTMNYSIIIMLILAMTMALTCLVISLIIGEFLMAITFMFLLGYLAHEIQTETSRSN